jgi:hypothetical protein
LRNARLLSAHTREVDVGLTLPAVTDSSHLAILPSTAGTLLAMLLGTRPQIAIGTTGRYDSRAAARASAAAAVVMPFASACV